MDVLREVRADNPDAPVWKFHSLVWKKKCGVSGYVEHPFWEDMDVEPCQFLCQDLLHGAHKFFWDHPCKWIASLIGAETFDQCISHLPKEGHCQFKNGLSKLRQASGHEHKDVQKYIAPAMAQAPGVTAPFTSLIIALLHIISILQLPMIDGDNLSDFDRHLEVVYLNADELIKLCIRKNLWIPKLMALPCFQQDIILGGVPSNWSSEAPETLHKLLPKSLYDQTNH
jgi:hypothetical protein